MQGKSFIGQVLTVLVIGVKINFCKADHCDDHVIVAKMRDIVIGRCLDYQTTLHPETFCTEGFKNCTELWEKISVAFVKKPECTVTADVYTDYIEAANHPIVGKQLFYSGLYGLAHRYSVSGTRYTTVEDTLIGYLIDRIKFCAGNASQDVKEQCERYNPDTCPYTARGSFWEAASINFARNAVGHVYVLLNATREPIVKSTSYFTKYEVTNLDNQTVTRLSAILINDSPSSKRDPCNSDESLQMLKEQIETKNIAFDCHENPSDLVYLYCMDNPRAELCKSLNSVSGSSYLHGKIFLLYIAVTFASNYFL